MSEQEEIEILIGRAKRRLESAHHLFEKDFYEEAGINCENVVELTFGILLHGIAFGMEKKFGKHMDTHVGLPRELRRLGERRVVEVFEIIDTFRAGRWYGSKSNGNVVEKCIESIESIKEWAQE